MNATMITTAHREYQDTLNHYNEVVNNELLAFATKFYGESFTPAKQKEICALSFEDKVWLLEQYKEELSSGTPDLSHLY
jgi:hypothetical protein